MPSANTASTSAAPVLAADQAAVRGIPQAVSAAWAANDADAFAEVFAADASLILPGDVYLKSQAEIRAFMAAAYQGPFKGTRVFGEPLAVRYLSGEVGVVITQGGVLAPGETEVAAERAIRATWVVTKQGQDWKVSAYHNSRIAD